jgi:protein-L-isoaspartate(D-aspartate) O-methyltransferase
MNRADFIPDVVWVREDGWYVPLNRADAPEKWLALVDDDDAIVTQVDDGTDRYEGRGVIPTSSSSAPGVMTRMIDLLDVHEGVNVLEVGTGTGYNAALIAEKAAPGHVTTIEVDEGIAAHARTALANTGLPVTVVTGDGTLGYRASAPYGRVMATACAQRVPYAWVEQTRPGGKIVVPLVGSFDEQALLRLDVGDDGTARGRFHGAVSFMRLHNQRRGKALWWRRDEDTPTTTTRGYPQEPFTEFGAGFACGLRLPGWAAGTRDTDEGAILLMSHFASGSWATVTPHPTGEHMVHHEGPRRLWEELEAAYRWWTGAGRPDHTRFGMTVTPEGQTFWLDTPDHVVSRQ